MRAVLKRVFTARVLSWRRRLSGVVSRVAVMRRFRWCLRGSQLRVLELQPLHALRAEVYLDPGIRPRTLGIHDHALAELRVDHVLADAKREPRWRAAGGGLVQVRRRLFGTPGAVAE